MDIGKSVTPGALAEVDPANLDPSELAELFRALRAGMATWLEQGGAWKVRGRGIPAMPAVRGADDDYAACGNRARGADIRDLFMRNFYFGCEADDPMNAWGFNARVNPYGAKLKTLFGSESAISTCPTCARYCPRRTNWSTRD